MPENRSINLQLIEKVASALAEINEKVIYVGGAVVTLYATDIGADQPRPTFDIDVSVQISTYGQMDKLREELADKNIYPASTETIIYRFVYDGILIDFIPFEETPLGPTNKWFKPGFKSAYPILVGDSTIRILPVSLFLATKWEAFKGRGNDPRTSHDFEDIIFVIENNLNLINEVTKESNEVQNYLKEMAQEILSHSSRNEIIECHLNPLTAIERRGIVIEKLNKILMIN